MEIAIALHELSAFLSYITIGIHVAASLYSRYKGEGVWNAMVPVWREDSKKNTKLVSRLEVLENKIYDEIEDRFIKQIYIYNLVSISVCSPLKDSR